MEWMTLPLRRYADFTGRSQRQEYWMFILLSALLYVAAFVLLVIFVAMSEPDGKKGDLGWSTGLGLGIVLIALLYLGLFIPTLAARVRRFHDQDLSGWFALLGFIPNFGWIIMIIFMCMDGTAGPNRFGPDPKGRGGGQHADIFA
jgi:uncharacterized membrane protein YhaH (DUF805 family)